MSVAFVAHLFLWLEASLFVQALAALVLCGLLPGLFLTDLLVGFSAAPPERSELLLAAIAAGYALMVMVMLLLSYFPGGLTRFTVLATFDGVLVGLLGLWLWRMAATQRKLTLAWRGVNPLVVTGLILLVTVGGYLRMANLGYAEFHGDEARGVLRAAAVIQGYEDVLFLHKKGPTEIVLPALLFSLGGHLNESTARLPFALANVAALCAIWLLGWRLFGPLAGWLAAFLLAFDGYLIAFARFVQYQSVVLLTSTLVVLLVYRLWRDPRALANYLTLAAILWATGLLSHYDALTTALPIGLLLAAMLWQGRLAWPALLRGALPVTLVGGALLASFYVPYLLSPNFQSTVTYLVDQRFVAGQSFPYNGLHEIFRRSLVYNSVYYVVFMVGLLALALALAYRRSYGRMWGSSLAIGVAVVLALTVWRTTIWRVGAVDLAIVPFSFAMVLIWPAPRLRMEERLLWFWFGSLFLITFFAVALARTHIYVFFTPWALLVGGLLANAWAAFGARSGTRVARVGGSVAVAALTLVFGVYAAWYFAFAQVEALKSWPANRPPGYWMPSYTKEVDSLYGFPMTNGWKVVGALYADGVIQGDYETNERYLWIPHWYTLGQHRCGSTAEWYFAIDNLEPWTLPSADLEDLLEEQGYVRWGQVTVYDAPRMTIYHQGDPNHAPAVKTLAWEAARARFDQALDATLPLISPIVEEPIQNPLHLNFDDDIWLEGYAIEHNTGLKPGDSFRLTLYWRAQRTGIPAYKVFNQAYYGDGVMVAQKDAIPVCDREQTTLWSPGELIIDIHDIPIADDAPPGVYPLHTGLYRQDDGTRAQVVDADGNLLGDSVQLAEIEITAP